MKTAIFATPLLVLFAATQSFAAIPVLNPEQAQVEHGGGCRKDSPAGQCCHAGSQPYHCH